MADIIEVLVKHVVDTRYEDLPSEAIEYAKKSILDTIGAAIAGSSEKGIVETVGLIKQWGGREEATIWVFGGSVPANLAAIVIGGMARAKELGDFHNLTIGVHATESILPAAFPIAEYVGNVDGKKFITAVALAQDIHCRLGRSIKPALPESGRNTLVRVLGPAVACCKILELDEDKTHNAFGIAYSGGFASGDMQGMIDGSMTVFLHYGFGADGAIKSVLLAQRGIRGTKNILQGRWGFYNVFEPEHDLAPLTQGLGKRFEGAYSSTKPYPSCGATHRAINVVLDLIDEHDIQPQDIEEMEIGMSSTDREVAFLPEEVRYNPPNAVSARFSVPYLVSTAAIKRSVSLEDFTDESLMRADVRETMKKVRGVIHPEIADRGVAAPVIARIRLKDGTEHTKRLDVCKGHPDRPMTIQEIAEGKVRKYVSFSARPMPRENVEQLIQMVSNLEEINNVSEIVKLLVP